VLQERDPKKKREEDPAKKANKQSHIKEGFGGGVLFNESDL
jgi:hypothetical protein